MNGGIKSKIISETSKKSESEKVSKIAKNVKNVSFDDKVSVRTYEENELDSNIRVRTYEGNEFDNNIRAVKNINLVSDKSKEKSKSSMKEQYDGNINKSSRVAPVAHK